MFSYIVKSFNSLRIKNQIKKELINKWLSCVILFIAVSVGFFFTLSNNYWSDGDEVHYLIMTNSFLADGDFSLQNNYDSKEYFSHHGFPVNQHAVTSPLDGSRRSWHGILLPIMVSPGYLARNILGARMLLFVYCLIGLWFSFKFLREFGFSENLSRITVALFALQMPILAYSQYVYTDMVGGYGIMLVSLLTLKFVKTKKLYWIFGASITSGLLIFLHLKIIAFTVICILSSIIIYILEKDGFISEINSLGIKDKFQTVKSFVRLVLNIRHWRLWLLAFGPIIFFLFLLSVQQYRWFGVFNFNQVNNLVYDDFEVLSSNPIRDFFGLTLDVQYGLFTNAPWLLMLIPGWMLWVYKHPKSFFIFGTPALVYLSVNVRFVVWRSWGPPARYLIMLLPVSLPGLALAIQQSRKYLYLKVLNLVLLVASFAVVIGLFVSQAGGYAFIDSSGANKYWNAFASLFGKNWPEGLRLLDFYYLPRMLFYFQAVLIYLVLLAIGLFLIYKIRQDKLR